MFSTPLEKVNKTQITMTSRPSLYTFAYLLSSLLFCLFLSVPAKADEASDIARIHQIYELANSDNAEGLKQLQLFQTQLTPKTTPKVRFELYKALITVFYDAGKVSNSNDVVAEMLRLAEAVNDKDMWLVAKVFTQVIEIDKSHAAKALDELAKIKAEVDRSKSMEVHFRFHYASAYAYEILNKADLVMMEYKESLKYAEQLSFRRDYARFNVLSAIANFHLNHKDPEKALHSIEDALKILTPGQINNKNHINGLLSKGSALLQLKRFPESLVTYEQALKLAKQSRLPMLEISAGLSVADVYLKSQRYKEAESLSLIVLEQTKQIDDEYYVIWAKANLGLAYGYNGKQKEGMELITQALDYFKAREYKNDLLIMYSDMADMYERTGMLKDALAILKAHRIINDEIYQNEKSKVIATLQEEFDAEQRKKQILLLARENALKDAEIKNHRLEKMLMVLGVILILSAGAFIYNLYRKVRKSNELLQEVNQQLEFHAVHDPLTGLYNRRSFFALMENRRAALALERRESLETSDTLILMDIDFFKTINDTYGHAAGDAVLAELAKRLSSVVRETDMVLRWGGEEFLIYSRRSPFDQIIHLVDRVLKIIADEPIYFEGRAISVTLTAGFISLPFSDIPDEICDWEKTLQIADMALYLGKTNGRNRAYGIAKLLVPYQDGIDTVTSDLAAAILQNMVEIIEVLGPEPKSANAKVEGT
jgi:diguanylate cyclase (GGDEF)-like protein